MVKRSLAAAALLTLLAGPAFAFHCPKDMAQIDAALQSNPQLSVEKLAEVRKLRAEGEELHEAGKHQQSVDKLAQAKQILGIS